MNEKHVNYLSLGKNDADIMAAGTLISQASDMTEGVIAVVNSTNTTVVTEQTSGKVRIVQRVGNDLIYSPFIDVTDIRAKRGAVGVESVQQVSYVGYNGADGALNDAVSSDYIIRSIFKTSREIADWAYKSGTTTTESLVAKGLLDNILAWQSRQAEQKLKIERVAATSSVAVVDTDTTSVIYKLTKGLKSVLAYTKTADDTAGLTASTVGVTAGTAVHIASAGAKSFSFTALALGTGDGNHMVSIGATNYLVVDAGTAGENATAIAAAINAGTQAVATVDTAAVTITYKEHIYGTLPPMVLKADATTWANVVVTALSGDLIPLKYLVKTTVSGAASFELDIPWQGETGYLYATTGATTTSSIGIATLNGDTFGLKFTGISLPHDAETRHYHTVKFTLGIDGDFSVDTPITYSIDGSEGLGTKAQIAISERQLQMNDGQSWVSAYPSVNYRKEVDKMDNSLFPLSIVTVDCIDSNFVPILGDNPKSYYTVTIATPNATGYGKLKTVFAI